jgi:hypothetical protein
MGLLDMNVDVYMRKFVGFVGEAGEVSRNNGNHDGLPDSN